MKAGPGARAAYGPLIGLLAGGAYGITARLVFDQPGPTLFGKAFAAMSVAFLFLVPLALGALTVHFAAPQGPWRWVTWLLLPWASCLLFLAAIAGLALEGLICIVMAAPIFLFLASLGGLVVGLLQRESDSARSGITVTALALLPFLASPLEQRTATPVERRRVETTVRIHASPEVVWRNVVRVPVIGHDELPSSAFDMLGIPLPVEATLDHDGNGALRTARFESGLVFKETVTEWKAGRTLGFDIAVDRDTLSPRLLDRHVAVGGEYFDVLHGQFALEPAGDGVVLRLVSVHRLSTRLNAYAGLWTDAVMADLQRRICDVIRRRAETPTRSS